ncbi:hypothetical protein C4F40_08550 [Sphingobacterium sp. Ka21]|uniref:Cardiolipin synthase N-terminal domain-containing protein n=1 Tax=Sphingobacterium pedocola TaxID=2082722 RepID=A0ABR9T815_9SPHI|nr:hypothetical protein [Sphingobacterium pedocola]
MTKQQNLIIPLTLLLLPLISITAWFLLDGGISHGYNFIYYWIWIIGFLIVFNTVVAVLLIYKSIKRINTFEYSRIFYIGLALLIGSTLYFMVNLN